MMSDTEASLQVWSTRVCCDDGFRGAVVELDPSGTVTAISRCHEGGPDVLDLGDAIIAPAPLDIHIHGAAGHSVPPGSAPRQIDAALDATMRRVSHPDAPHVPRCSWLATLPLPAIEASSPDEQVAAAALSIAGDAATGCIGVRVEGVFLNPARAGAWPADTLRAPDVALLEAMHDAARAGGSRLRVVDIAPELPGAVQLIERARELGIIASLAHSDATWDQARAAVDAGATLATHTWNAMRPLTHRDPGIVAAVLTDPRVTCELICDGIHLHPGTVALSIAAAGPGGWCAVSDASPIAGRLPGTYRWGDVELNHDGTALRDGSGNLAGSASLLDRALDVLGDVGAAAIDIVRSVGAVPRRVLSPDRSLGLEVGDPVWIVAADQGVWARMSP